MASVQNGTSKATRNVKGGRLELLVPHILRGQLLRPGFDGIGELLLGHAETLRVDSARSDRFPGGFDHAR